MSTERKVCRLKMCYLPDSFESFYRLQQKASLFLFYQKWEPWRHVEQGIEGMNSLSESAYFKLWGKDLGWVRMGLLLTVWMQSFSTQNISTPPIYTWYKSKYLTIESLKRAFLLFPVMIHICISQFILVSRLQNENAIIRISAAQLFKQQGFSVHNCFIGKRQTANNMNTTCCIVVSASATSLNIPPMRRRQLHFL